MAVFKHLWLRIFLQFLVSFMRKLFERLHLKIGDFWWYSIMLFCAYRTADALNAFVGLWLVPKYVSPEELGAVVPLSNFANCLALPLAAFANAFRNEVSRLSVERNMGQLKTLLRSVFVATGIFLAFALVVVRFALPLFLERIRIVEGSLGILILIASFLGAISPFYTFALQSLKKFKEQSIMSVVGAPIRLLTMLVAMPFRALSGYFVGQSAPTAFGIIASLFCLRKELSVKAEPYWSRAVVRRFARTFILFAIGGLASNFYVLIESTILRQRLPDIDSAGYYMVSRFSEIANFLYLAIVFAMFPFSAELAAKGKNYMRLVFKAGGVVALCNVLLAIPFFFFGRDLLAILPNGADYSQFWWAIPWQIALHSSGAFIGLYLTAEMSANRFGYLKWTIPFDLIYPVILLLVTGHGYFAGYIPASWTAFLTEHNIYSLSAMLIWMTVVNILKLIVCVVCMLRTPCRGDV